MRSIKAAKNTPVKSIDDAQFLFRELVGSYRARALWFMNPAQAVDITSSSSYAVLDYIAKKCSQADWIIIKKLKQWLLQNIR